MILHNVVIIVLSTRMHPSLDTKAGVAANSNNEDYSQ